MAKPTLLPPDFHDLICALNAAECDYILVESYALALHGLPRYTGDIDFFYRRTLENTRRLVAGLHEFGYSSRDLTPESLMQKS